MAKNLVWKDENTLEIEEMVPKKTVVDLVVLKNKLEQKKVHKAQFNADIDKQIAAEEKEISDYEGVPGKPAKAVVEPNVDGENSIV